MIYWILKFLMTFVLRIYYRRIFLIDSNNLPSNKPVVLACNHANSFLDDIISGTLLKRQLHFLARSDVFKTKLQRIILGQMYMLPIYRALEGTKDLHKNQDTFRRTTAILEKKGAIMIHSEGICVIEKRLRPLKKGTGRLAFIAEDSNDFKLDLHVVPVAFNYTEAPKFRQELFITFSEPIKIKEYKSIYKENAAKAINSFNKDLNDRLKNNMVIIERPESESLVEMLFKIYRNNIRYNPLKWLFKSRDRFSIEQNIGNKINKLYNDSISQFKGLQNKSISYFSSLRENGLKDISNNALNRNNLMKDLFLILFFPLSVIGKYVNYIPALLTNYLTKKAVKSDVFFASVNIGIGMILYILYFGILLTISLIVFGSFGILIALLFPFTYYFHLLYKEALETRMNLSGHLRLRKLNPDMFNKLREERSEIIELVDRI